MSSAWGVSWGSSWGNSWGAGGTPVVVPVDTGGSGNQSGRRRNVNDDPDAFSELLKEWRAKGKKDEKGQKPQFSAPNIPDAISSVPKATETVPDEADDLQEHVRSVEAAFDRSMLAYEAALAKVEQAKVAKAAKAQKARQASIRQAAIEQEEHARQQAMQLAIEWEQARLAYEDFLEDEDEIMLLS